LNNLQTKSKEYFEGGNEMKTKLYGLLAVRAGSRRGDGLRRDEFPRPNAEPFDAWFHDG
jgi:hypothetical protein